MAQQNIVPPLNAVDTVAQVPLGTVVEDENGKEYIYLGGVANTVAGSFVAYNVSTFLTALTVAASAGRCAVAQAAVLLGQFGWYCVKGNGVPVVTAGATVVGAAVFIVNASPGVVDDAVVATDRIENAYFTTTTTPAGAVDICYPQAIGLG